MTNENIIPKGRFQMLVIDAKTNDVLECYENNNLVVNVGKSNLAKLLVGDFAGSKVSKIAFGTNSTTPAITDTSISSAFTKPIDGYSFPSGGQAMITWSLTADEANGMNINELGLITDAGTLFARKVRSTISKTSAIRLVGTWTITIN